MTGKRGMHILIGGERLFFVASRKQQQKHGISVRTCMKSCCVIHCKGLVVNKKKKRRFSELAALLYVKDICIHSLNCNCLFLSIKLHNIKCYRHIGGNNVYAPGDYICN